MREGKHPIPPGFDKLNRQGTKSPMSSEQAQAARSPAAGGGYRSQSLDGAGVTNVVKSDTAQIGIDANHFQRLKPLGSSMFTAEESGTIASAGGQHGFVCYGQVFLFRTNIEEIYVCHLQKKFL